jgi:hypothetical protein
MKIEISVSGADQLDRVTRGMRILSNGLQGPLQVQAAGAISRHMEKRARANAPIRKNVLRPSIRATPPKLQGKTASANVKVDAAIRYVIAMHEHLTPFGVPLGTSSRTGKPIYSLGPISRVQPMTKEGGVGGRFITRVMKVHQQQYERQLGAVMFGLLKTGHIQKFRLRP